MKHTIYIIALLLCCSLVFAASFITPISGAKLSNDIQFDVRTVAELQECIVDARSVTSGSSTSFSLTLASGNNIRGLVDTKVLPDASDWEFAGECYNAEIVEPIEFEDEIVIDNTAPTIVLESLQKENEVAQDLWIFTCTNAWSGNIKFGTDSYPLEKKDGKYIFDASVIADNSYLVVASCTDGKDTATMQLKNIQYKRERPPEYIQYINETNTRAAEQPKEPTTAMLVLIVLGVVALVYLIVNRPKNI